MSERHISSDYDRALEELRQKILQMGGLVEEHLTEAMKALVQRDVALAKSLMHQDHPVNRLEMEVDDRAMRLLALRQPAARDLRFITMSLKISTDLERIGDQCVSIALRALELQAEPPLKPYIDLPRMALLAQTMVKESLDAFVAHDVVLAQRVLERDEEVDQLNDQHFRELLTFMIEDPRTIGRAMRLMFVAKSLERIADHATNIAEEVIFMVKGE
ncbi:MAG: phosphate transport system regulatory protein PhoU, partial [Deltaproteobacteria bacterium RBG_13_65_10]